MGLFDFFVGVVNVITQVAETLEEIEKNSRNNEARRNRTDDTFATTNRTHTSWELSSSEESLENTFQRATTYQLDEIEKKSRNIEARRNRTDDIFATPYYRSITSYELCSSEESLENTFQPTTTYQCKRFTRLAPVKLENPKYKRFENICRALHIDDIHECKMMGQLKSFDIPKKAHSCLSDKSMKVLWFGVSQDTNKHNWYGNVSFEINLKELFQKQPSLKAYYIDHVQFNKDTISRVLISNKLKYQLPSDIIEWDFRHKGYPLWKDDYGNFYAMTNHKRLDKNPNVFGHTVEFVIDATGVLPSFLYRNCIKKAVNHAKANERKPSLEYKSKVCFKFNKNGKECPYAYDEHSTREIMQHHGIQLSLY